MSLSAPSVKDIPYESRVSMGLVSGTTIVHKFGHNHNVGTSFVPVAAGGKWQTPQVGSETTLRVKAGNAADTANGIGGREVTIFGIDNTGAEVTEVLVTNGTSAGASGSVEFLRVVRAIVTKSGTYATATTNSHVAAIVIEDSTGTDDWLTIAFESGLANAQSQVGVFTVPLGKTAYITQLQIDADSNKSVDVLAMSRSGILETSPPYQPRTVLAEFIGVSGSLIDQFIYPFGPFGELTDLGFMAKVTSGTASVSVDFAILLIDN